MSNDISKWSHASQVFSHEFKVIVADTSELRDIVYGIRHQVYCQEFGFEPITSSSNSIEIDEFDAKSIHCLVQHRASKEYIGCVRIVVSPNYPSQECRLPFKGCFWEDLSLITRLQQYHCNQPMVEISRLAIKPEFRKHIVCKTSGSKIVQLQPGQKKWIETQKLKISTSSTLKEFYLVSKSLYVICALIVGDILQLDVGYAMMERRLARHLRSFGVHVNQISPFVEYKGSRALFSVGNQAIIENLHDGCPFIQTLREDLYPSLTSRLLTLGIDYRKLKTAPLKVG